MDALVSVIIPAYNVQRYISKCLESLVRQTYCAIEIIVVDDGSTDATASVVGQIASNDSRIRLVSRENRGPSAARNTGLDIAEGAYICFVDSDDYVDETFVETLVRGIEDCDLSMCGLIHETPSGAERLRTGGREGQMGVKEMLMNMFVPGGNSWGAYSCNRLYKRSILKENHLRFPEGYKMMEDMYFNYFYGKCCQTIYYDPTPVYHYIVNEKGIVHNIENTPSNINKWLGYGDVFDPVMGDAAAWDRDVFKMLKMYKMVHNATAVRVLTYLGQEKNEIYKEKMRFLRRNLIGFLFCGNVALKKRLGAALTAVAPGKAFRIWNKKR